MLFKLNYTDKQMLVYMESNPLTSNPKSKAIFTCLVNKAASIFSLLESEPKRYPQRIQYLQKCTPNSA